MTIHSAAAQGNLTAVRAFLARGVPVDFSQGKTGRSPLTHAAQAGQVEIAKFLLERKATVDGARDWTPLLAAAQHGRTKLAALLLDAGADINRACGDRWWRGDTPLMLAARTNSTPCVKLLLERKADTAATNQSGQTALDIAQHLGRSSIVSLLQFAAAAAPPPAPPAPSPLVGAERLAASAASEIASSRAIFAAAVQPRVDAVAGSSTLAAEPRSAADKADSNASPPFATATDRADSARASPSVTDVQVLRSSDLLLTLVFVCASCFTTLRAKATFQRCSDCSQAMA